MRRSRLSGGLFGCGLVFLLFPVAHAVVEACFDQGWAEPAGLVWLVLGFALVAGSLRVQGSVAQATMGLLAGFFLWAAVGEVPHHTGHGMHVGPDNWGILLVIGTYYLLSHTSPGRPFLTSLLRGAPDEARRVHPSRQGLQIAFEFFVVVWALHVLLLTAYYHPSFGVHSWFTYLIFGVTLLVTPVLLRSVGRIHDLAHGIRAGVLVASLLWTLVEILMKWGVLPKPWKPMNPWAIGVCTLLLAGWWWKARESSGRIGRS